MNIPLEVRRRVIVRGVNWVGDSVMATPALHRLRKAFAGSHITLLVRPWVAAIFEHSPDIDELWIEDDSASTSAFLSTAKRIRQGKFDFGIALPNSFRSALLLLFGGVKHRLGYARSGRSWLFTRALPVTPALLKEHEIFYYLNLIDWLGDEKPDPPKLVLVPGEKEMQEVDADLRRRGIDRGRLLVGIAPGAINSEAKLWLPERFAEVADRLQRTMNAEVMLLGSEKEKEVVNKVAGLCKIKPHNLAGEMSLGNLIALMSKLHLFIGNDSGAMHIAAALGVPSVAIFGPTEWTRTSPFSVKSKIVRHPVDCSPCMLRVCPIDHPCMKGVRVDDVLGMLHELEPDIKARMR